MTPIEQLRWSQKHDPWWRDPHDPPLADKERERRNLWWATIVLMAAEGQYRAETPLRPAQVRAQTQEKMPYTNQNLVSIIEASRVVRCHRPTLSRAVSAGEVPSVVSLSGKRRLVKLGDVRMWDARRPKVRTLDSWEIAS
jgi:hypothetical protein